MLERQTLMSDTLLIEFLTEELPPKALVNLSEALGKEIMSILRKNELLSKDTDFLNFETPRRLAVQVRGVLNRAPSKKNAIKLMPSHIGFDAKGKSTPSLKKKMQSLGLNSDHEESIYKKMLGKVEMLFVDHSAEGAYLEKVLQDNLDIALGRLPIPKLMTYQLDDGIENIKFARPVRGVLAIHGKTRLSIRILGVDSENVTKGHRFLSKTDIEISNADEYEDLMFKKGRVIASSKNRRDNILKQCRHHAKRLGYRLNEEKNSALLDEVTSLVEWPVVYNAQFDEKFLSLPSECLVLTMTTNQKYFPLYEKNGQLTNQFLLVSNMDMPDPSNIIKGNQRVISPRLHDARFFYENDIKTPLSSKIGKLKTVIFHHKLGTLFERSERISVIARHIAEMLQCSPVEAERAGEICKADLTTEMVAEFPELQGTIGKYYALYDNESPNVANAIEGQYLPKFHGDTVPNEKVSICLALADKIDLLIGIFGINGGPTGDKDPYALRRSGLGVARILIENKLPLNLPSLLNFSENLLKEKLITAGTATQVYSFILDRTRGYFREINFSLDEIESVLSQKPTSFDKTSAILNAIKEFKSLREAANLSSTNKRIKNILRKNYNAKHSIIHSNLQHDSEVNLHIKTSRLDEETDTLISANDFEKALKLLSEINDDINYFFESVLVIDKDIVKKNNRLALLANVEKLMNKVANISELDLSKN